MNSKNLGLFCTFFILLFLIGCSVYKNKPLTYGDYGDIGTEMEHKIDLKSIMENINHLSLTIGPRPADSPKNLEAANWFKEKLHQLGYTPQVHSFKIPDGNTRQNILCLLEGRTKQVIVIAAHLDTVEQSPGANDDASGIALILELARLFKQYKLKPEYTVMLAGFGAEETVNGFNGHTYSSLKYLKSLSAEARRSIIGCIYLDKIGVGHKLFIRNIIFTNSQMVKLFQEVTREINRPGEKLPLKYSWLLSLPMSFEKHGIPTAWIEWVADPNTHKANDLPKNIVQENILLVAKILLTVLEKKF